MQCCITRTLCTLLLMRADMKHMHHPLELFETGEIYCVSFDLLPCSCPLKFQMANGQSESSCIIGSFNHCVCVYVSVVWLARLKSSCSVYWHRCVLTAAILIFQVRGNVSQLQLTREASGECFRQDIWIISAPKKKNLTVKYDWRMKACKSLSQ